MGTDKALMKIEGETLLTRAIKLCQSVCDQLLISSNSDIHDFEEIVRISDEIRDCGPIGGIYSCLKQAENEWCFVISVDAVFVTSDFIEFLFKQTENFDAVVPVHKNGKEPLIAMYNKTCTDVIKAKLDSGNFKMHDLLEDLNTNFVDSDHWIEKNPKLFHNINSPEDL